jgi:hypothetical protein
MKPLTRCEKAMLARLQEEQLIKWHETIGCDVQTLNRLVKKGVAKRLYQGDTNCKSNAYWVEI